MSGKVYYKWIPKRPQVKTKRCATCVKLDTKPPKHSCHVCCKSYRELMGWTKNDAVFFCFPSFFSSQNANPTSSILKDAKVRSYLILNINTSCTWITVYFNCRNILKLKPVQYQVLAINLKTVEAEMNYKLKEQNITNIEGENVIKNYTF